jgi:hypothetical protein
MHVRHSNDTKYYLNENGMPIELQASKAEKYLGIFITADMKPSRQCIAAAAKTR